MGPSPCSPPVPNANQYLTEKGMFDPNEEQRSLWSPVFFLTSMSHAPHSCHYLHLVDKETEFKYIKWMFWETEK